MALNGYTVTKHPMNVSINILQAGAADIEDLAELFDAYRVFYGQTPNLQLARSFLRERLMQSESTIFLARDSQGRPVGFTQLYPTFSSIACMRAFILNDLYTVEAARGKGVGRALLTAARDHAAAAGAAYLTLETALDNSKAQSLYRSFGFVRDTQFCTYSMSLI